MKVLTGIFAIIALAITVYIWNPTGTATHDPRARVLGFTLYHIPSSSMSPTIKRNSYVFVSTYSFVFAPLQVGDIVVYQPPHVDSPFLGRVMAQEGDTVSVSSSIVNLNGDVLHEGYINDEILSCQFSEHAKATIPENHLFILGDNRCNSMDSRAFGYVRRDQLIGKVVNSL